MALDHLYRPLVECDRSQSRQRSQALLTACITGIDLHFIDIHRNAAKSAYCVYNEKRSMGMSDTLQFL